MDKIHRYRNTQEISFDDFVNDVIDKGVCKYCNSYEECLEAMGGNNMESISGNGCAGFDNSVEEIKKIYLIDKCTVKAS